MNVYWLEQTENDVPSETEWLSPEEALCLSRLHVAKRRFDWSLGRWTAKRALATYLKLPSDLLSLANIEIRAMSSGAPEAFLFNRPASVSISLSHSSGAAICTIAPAGVSLGCDLELIEPRSDAFVTDYFTSNEQMLVEQSPANERHRLVTLVWSAKESALKALREGLRLDTNCLDVRPLETLPPGGGEWQDPCPISLVDSASEAWQPLRVLFRDRKIFHGWWRAENQMVRSVVV